MTNCLYGTPFVPNYKCMRKCKCGTNCNRHEFHEGDCSCIKGCASLPETLPPPPLTPPEDERPSWAETWMDIARTVARMRSYDPRLKVGAIIVTEDNTRMLALGYNGNAKGLPNVPDSLEPGQSGFVHAEANCLIKCDYHYEQKKIMYVTHSPCRNCCKLILNGNIYRVVYDVQYRDLTGVELLKSAGVQVYTLDEAITLEQRK